MPFRPYLLSFLKVSEKDKLFSTKYRTVGTGGQGGLIAPLPPADFDRNEQKIGQFLKKFSYVINGGLKLPCRVFAHGSCGYFVIAT